MQRNSLDAAELLRFEFQLVFHGDFDFFSVISTAEMRNFLLSRLDLSPPDLAKVTAVCQHFEGLCLFSILHLRHKFSIFSCVIALVLVVLEMHQLDDAVARLLGYVDKSFAKHVAELPEAREFMLESGPTLTDNAAHRQGFAQLRRKSIKSYRQPSI